MPISDYFRNLRTRVGHDLLIMPSVTVISYDEQGRILLAKHADTNFWVAPGGSIEPYETPADAAVREMWEETGLLINPTRILGVYGGSGFLVTYSNGDKVTYVMTVFGCEILEGHVQADNDEILELAYFSQHDLKNLALAPWAQIVLPDMFNIGNTVRFKAPGWRPSDRDGR